MPPLEAVSEAFVPPLDRDNGNATKANSVNTIGSVPTVTTTAD